MSKKFILIAVLIGLHSGLLAQLQPTPDHREQIKRHSRVNLHEEKQLSGKIVKLLYSDAYEYLDGFILETAPGEAIKVESYFYLGKALFPYLKRGEQVRVTVSGDKDLLKNMMYKSAQDKKLEKSLKVNLGGMAHFKKIISSAGTLDSNDVEKLTKRDGSRYEIVKNAEISQTLKGKRRSIQLLLKNGDTINTYASSLASDHYQEGKVSYIRHLPPLKGMHLKSSRTFHMVNPYIYGPIIPTRHDFKVTAMGQRSIFLDEAVGMRFLSSNTPAKGRVTHTKWLSPDGDTLNMTFSNELKERLDNFLATNGRQDISLQYWKHRVSKNNYLYGLEKDNALTLLKEASFGDANQRSTTFKFLTGKRKKEETTSITAKGVIKKYLTTTQGTYAGIRLENDAGEEQVFRFLGTHGEDILNRFKVGDLVEVTAQNISPSDLLKVRFQNAKLDLESFANPPDFSSHVVFGAQTWTTIIHDKDKKGRTIHAGFTTTKTPYVSRITSRGKELDLDINTENQPASNLPSELSIDIEVAKISKKKGKFTFYMRNGDTLSSRSNKSYKKGEKVSYLQKFPQVLKGQVNKDPKYAQTPLKTLFAKKRQLTGPLEPIYDDWMRLMGYESEVEGKKGRVRISTDLAKNVNAFLSQQRNTPLTLFCNELITSKNAPVYYFFMGLQNAQGELIYDNQMRQQQYFEVDTTFNSKVKDVVQHSDLYTYSKTTVILENGFVFSIRNKEFGSIGASSFVGSEITITGKPLVPRKGEILKDENYRLIKPSQLTVGSIEFKISD